MISLCAAALIVAGGAGVAGAGCETGSGGAVELSWKLRPNSSALEDQFVDCDPGSDDPNRGAVTWIQLKWDSIDDTGVVFDHGHAEWHCDDNHGVTGFSLPEGTASLSVIPECGAQIPADTASYIAPAPVLRDVSRANTISLNAIELVITVAPCAANLPPCICTSAATGTPTPTPALAP